MPPRPRTPRNAWVDAALDLLAARGVDEVRVEAVATRLGVTKGGFYGLFGNREALLTALLEEWERRATEEVLTTVAAADLPEPERLRLAGQLTFAPELLTIDLAIRSWARRDPSVAARLRRVDNVRMDFLRGGFASLLSDPDEIEARSATAFAVAIGFPLLSIDHPGRRPEDILTLISQRLLFGAPGEQDRSDPPAPRPPDVPDRGSPPAR